MDKKFRVWDTRAKQMSPVFSLFGEFTLVGAVHAWQAEICPERKDTLSALNDLIVMQFVDLRDDNGENIFEDDVITVSKTRGGMRLTINLIVKVPDIYFGSGARYLGDTWIKVGNIYENPELIEGEEKE